MDKTMIGAIGSSQLDDFLSNDTITIDTSQITSQMSNYVYSDPTYSYGNITICSSSGLNGSWSSNPLVTNSSGLHVTSDAMFEGDVKIKGVSILETLDKIEKRLSILRPDPEKLAHFESLKKAYEHYKTLEALCELPTKEEE